MYAAAPLRPCPLGFSRGDSPAVSLGRVPEETAFLSVWADLLPYDVPGFLRARPKENLAQFIKCDASETIP